MTTDEAVAWLLSARRLIRRLALGHRALMTPDEWFRDFEQAERDARERGETDHDIPLSEEMGPLAL